MAQAIKTMWSVTDLQIETGLSYFVVLGLLDELAGGDKDDLKPAGHDIVLDAQQHKAFLALVAKRAARGKASSGQEGA